MRPIALTGDRPSKRLRCRYEFFIRVRMLLLLALGSWKVIKVLGGLYGHDRWSSNIWFFQFLKDWSFGFLKL